MKKAKWILFATVMILGSFLFFYTIIPFEASKLYNGYIYSTDGSVAEKTTITIHGKVDRSFAKDSIFLGTIKVSDDIDYDFKMTKDDGYYHGVILSKESNYTEVVGSVSTSADFKLIWAKFDKMDEKYNADTYVVGPASSVEEGLSISEQITSKK